ncbi:MAG TPA: hypothetical protein VMR54_11570 [Thermoanaerobaculia bacterium]|nr:hypothetical protein [Thermoanaerobaculia bacterium]
MNRLLRLTPLALLALVLLSGPAAQGQMAKPEMKSPPHAVVSLYRIAPGKHLDFLKWLADQEAIAKEAGVPASQLYAHTNGDSWDYMNVAPDLTPEQQAKVDDVAKKHGRKTGFAANLEFRTYVAWHTDTETIGPVTPADLISAASK